MRILAHALFGKDYPGESDIVHVSRSEINKKDHMERGLFIFIAVGYYSFSALLPVLPLCG